MDEDIPKAVRSDKNNGVGISSISFNSEDPSIFFIGAEGGAVMICSTASQVQKNYILMNN